MWDKLITKQKLNNIDISHPKKHNLNKYDETSITANSDNFNKTKSKITKNLQELGFIDFESSQSNANVSNTLLEYSESDGYDPVQTLRKLINNA